MTNNIPRAEYPRPQLVRQDWLNLNGTWEFEIDHGVTGRERKLQEAAHLSGSITVPFCPESELSGVGYKDFMAAVWYKKEVELPQSFAGKRVLFHMGACDYETEVFVNGKPAGVHIGGYCSFSFDVTELLAPGKNVFTVFARDDTRSGEQPLGKQSTDFYSAGCFYTRTTGIWQTVWLEAVPQTYISLTRYRTFLDGTVGLEIHVKGGEGKEVKAQASWQGSPVAACAGTVRGEIANLTLHIDQPHLWDAGQPNLYDLTLTVGEDSVESYFGIREIVYEDHKLKLNGRPVFQRLVLDQGFYPDGIYTAPTDGELKADIQRSLDCGFNGARLHEKIFEERFLYHCDTMGYLVWGEFPNWGLDISRATAWKAAVPEWLDEMNRDYNHPAIVGWCPFNETQENQDPVLIKAVCDVTRAADPTRPIVDCSGWHHVKGAYDVCDCHDYEQDPAAFAKSIQKRQETDPDMTFVSEYGGIWWCTEADKEGWGYGQRVRTKEEFMARYKGLTEALLQNPEICAFCYTQLTDVEFELNGMYTYDRVPKFDMAEIAKINRQKAAIEE